MNNVYMGLDVDDFIFGEGTMYDDSYDDVTDEELNEFGVIKCTEDPDVACYRIALENEQNHNAIMTAMLTREYNFLESTGSVMVYEASKIENFLEMVKTNIQKFWAKVKGVFKKLMDNISSIVLSNKAFVKKYRSANISIPKDAKKFTGYKFTNLNINYSKVVDIVKLVANATAKDYEKYKKDEKADEKVDEIRGALLNTSGIKAIDFDDELKKYLYGSVNTEVMVPKNFQALLNDLETADSAKKSAKNAYKEAEKTIKGLLSEVKKEKADSKTEDAEKRAKAKAEIINKSLTVMSTALNAHVRAITASAVQDRKMANYLVRVNNNPKVKMKNESAFEDDIDVVLI